MVTVYFFLVITGQGGVIQAGPFIDIDQCNAARAAAEVNVWRTSKCYEGTWWR